MTRRRVLLVAAIAIGLAGYALVLHQTYTWRANTHPDFYIEWFGSRVALQGGNPYSDETAQAIQLSSKNATSYHSHYEPAMALPPLIVLLAMATWYGHKEWKHGSRTRTASNPA